VEEIFHFFPNFYPQDQAPALCPPWQDHKEGQRKEVESSFNFGNLKIEAGKMSRKWDGGSNTTFE
jgi:hypothetical protein